MGRQAGLRSNSPAPHPSSRWPLTPPPDRPAPQLIDKILDLCNAQQLGMLTTACSFFRKAPLIPRLAQDKLREISRAKGMLPRSQ